MGADTWVRIVAMDDGSGLDLVVQSVSNRGERA